MKSTIKKYFTFNNRERNGIILLLAIIVLLIISIQLTPYFIKPPGPAVASLTKAEPLDVQSSSTDTLESAMPVSELESIGTFHEKKKKELFNFNPNTVTPEELNQLGLTPKFVRTFTNYRNKGGHFYKKEDFKKVYGLSDQSYHELEPFIIFENHNEPISLGAISPASNIPKLPIAKEPAILELNTCDSLALLNLRGIGPSFAHRIIAYRNKLGGFYSLEQLKEVYGLDSSKYDLILPQLKLNAQNLNRLNINTVTAEELKKHPYIKYSIANLIINYRNQHGVYKNIEEVKKLRLISDELYSKLEPYLTID